MNTIGCSPIGLNRLSSWFSERNHRCRETLLGDGDTDGEENARLEPRSVLRRVEPYLYEFAGARPEKPIHKLTALCEVMEVHPFTLLTLAYAGDNTRKADQLLAQVRQELEAVLKECDAL